MTRLNRKVEVIKRIFAHYGFVTTPLNEDEILSLLILKFSRDEIYSIGCDVNSGYSFKDIVNEQVGLPLFRT